MYSNRISLYQKIEQERETKVLAYVTGDRRGLETQMSSDVLDFFVHHLDKIGAVNKISLILHTRGGETLSAWSIVNLLRSFGDRLEIIIPARCHSAGTLICLGADNLVMTKQSTLGPIDPSVNTPLNPELPGGQPMARVPVSVEDINAFLEHARESLGDDSMTQAFDRLAQHIHPLVLGNAYRVRSQIRMLGERLLSSHITDQATIEEILDFLCSDSGSHDYTINRKEARERLGLPVETPSWGLYDLIKKMYDDIVGELELNTQYEVNSVLHGRNQKNYAFRRALIESVAGGSHVLISEGIITRTTTQIQPGVPGIQISDKRLFEGWRHNPDE